jgi:hypothetical protein
VTVDGDHRSNGRFLEANASLQAEGALLIRPEVPTVGFCRLAFPRPVVTPHSCLESMDNGIMQPMM